MEYYELSVRSLVGHLVEWAYLGLKTSNQYISLLTGLGLLGNFIKSEDLSEWEAQYQAWDYNSDETKILDDIFEVGRRCMYTKFDRVKQMKEFYECKSKLDALGVHCEKIEKLIQNEEGFGQPIIDYIFSFDE